MAKKKGKIFWVIVILLIVGSIIGFASGGTQCSGFSAEDGQNRFVLADAF